MRGYYQTIAGWLSSRWGKESGRDRFAPPHVGIEATAEILATFNGELADRHPPTALADGDQSGGVQATENVRLLTWGDPYLAAWLEAIRGEPLTQENYREARLQPGENPL